MPSNKRLTVTVEVWHNRSPHVRSAVADKIQTKHQNLWNGWNNDDYPWTLAMPDPEDDPVEDDSRFYVQVIRSQFQKHISVSRYTMRS